jgi:hypothetical protein
MTRAETSYTANIYLAGGSVFKVQLSDNWREEHWDPPEEPISPSILGPDFARTLTKDSPGRNTLVAIDWDQVVAITYRRPAEGAGGRPIEVMGADVLAAIEANGGTVESKRELCRLMDRGHVAVDRALTELVKAGKVAPFDGPRRAVGYLILGDRAGGFGTPESSPFRNPPARSESAGQGTF